MPKIGYRCTANFNVYLTAGIQYIKHWNKVTVSRVGVVDSKIDKTKKGRIYPVIGLGGRYDFVNKMFIKLEYNHLLKSKVVSPTKYNCHIVKIGIGYVF
jgi:opacity protein-like surface antigen